MSIIDLLHAPDLELVLDCAYGHLPEPQLPAVVPHVGGCTGKHSYPDRKAAVTMANQRARWGVTLRAYACPNCRQWHLTKRQ